MERFHKKYQRGAPDACWPWQSSCSSGGYGAFRSGRSMKGAHIVAWELANGASADGLSVMHTCDNPACVNPGHLVVGTPQDNTRDMMAKGRAVFFGEQYHG